jgi:YfiH family protein
MPVETIISKRSAVSSEQLAVADETLAESGFYWREHKGVKVLVCRPLEDAGFANGFSTRLGGVSSLLAGESSGSELNLAGFNEDSAENIHENRRRFLAAFDKPYKLALAWQIHGDTIRLVRDDQDAGDSNEHADAVASDLANVLAGVKTADCVPVLLADPVAKAFAAVHAGWRGTLQSIVVKAIDKMTEAFGTDPQNLLAAIGPAASGRCYEVGQDVIDAFVENFEDGQKYFQPTKPDHAFVDLHRANHDQLSGSGVKPENIFTAPFCTISHIDLFFSYRIEKKRFGRTGRLLSVIGRL